MINYLLSILSKSYSAIAGIAAAVLAFFIYREGVKQDERERISRESDIADLAMREKALRERIENEKTANSLDIDDKRAKLRKYTRKDK